MKKKLYVCFLVISASIAITSVLLLIYISFYKTDISLRIGNRIGLIEHTPVRVDDNCVISWNNSLKQLNLDVDIVFFGNSITAGGDFQSYFNDKKIINLGYIGEDTKGMLRRVEQIKSVKPEKVFMMAGINGLKNQDESMFYTNYACLVDSILNSVPNVKLYLESILPVTNETHFCENNKIILANRIIYHIAKERGLEYIDLHQRYFYNGSLPPAWSYRK